MNCVSRCQHQFITCINLLWQRVVTIYSHLQVNRIIQICVYVCMYIYITYLLTPWSRVLLEKLTGSATSQEIPRILEPEGSSPYSQVPATCPYPEPTPSSPHNPFPLPEDAS